jgi:hypothetical protein
MRTTPRHILVLALAAAALALAVPAAATAKTAFDGNGMWIWEIDKAEGGSNSAIIHKARSHDIRTVFLKSGDGTTYTPRWSQFPDHIHALKAGGLKVCGWQYVYGDHPKDEAKVAIKAIRDGADCFVIDAESQYEGKYSSARKYVRKIREAVGSRYPIGLAGFPFVDYHPSFPYSVFLGPGAAQFNVPQIYWKELSGFGDLDTVMAHSYRWNLPYGRAIYPLGQLYDGVHGRPSSAGIRRFRKYAAKEGAKGLSWWSWQHAVDYEWKAIDAPISALKDPVETDFETIQHGDSGDIVFWAQEHLEAAGQSVPVDGQFGSSTKSAVKRFQKAKGLRESGKIDTATWRALLKYKPGSVARAKVGAGGGERTPRTASLPAKRYEIPPPGLRGR